MTGHAQEAEPQPQRTVPQMRSQPQTSAAYDEEQDVDPERDRIEIPAFLRRQAN